MNIATSLYNLVTSLRSMVSPPIEGLTLTDVQLVRTFLGLKGLPPEISDIILDYAEYWVIQHFSNAYEEPQGKRLLLRVNDMIGRKPPAQQISALFLETDELGCSGALDPALLTPQHRTPKCRRVVFKIRSRDQGWADAHDETDNPYFGSFSWFDATIFRPTPGRPHVTVNGVKYGPWETLRRTPQSDLRPDDLEQTRAVPDIRQFYVVESPEVAGPYLLRDRWRYVEGGDDNGVTWLIQRNRVAKEQLGSYEVVWTAESGLEDVSDDMAESSEEQKERKGWAMNGAGSGAGFVDSLQMGDRIGVWPRAKVRLPKLPIYEIY